MQDQDPNQKIPTSETQRKHLDNEEEDQGNGQGNGQGDGIGDAQEKVQKSRDNRKYKGKGTITFS